MKIILTDNERAQLFALLMWFLEMLKPLALAYIAYAVWRLKQRQEKAESEGKKRDEQREEILATVKEIHTAKTETGPSNDDMSVLRKVVERRRKGRRA